VKEGEHPLSFIVKKCQKKGGEGQTFLLTIEFCIHSVNAGEFLSGRLVWQKQ
jgi:hypothetical protein